MLQAIFLILLVSGCGKPSAGTASNATSTANNPQPDNWLIFEDDWFRIAYPAGSDVGGGPDGKQDPKFPTLAVVPPTAGGGIHGAFTLQFEKRTTGMLLRDAIQSEVESGLKNRGMVLSAPREIKVSNGKCMSAVTSRPFDHCPKDSGNCYASTIHTLCDDGAGRRFTAMTLLSVGPNQKGLTAQAQQEAATYERILRSLEFKKS